MFEASGYTLKEAENANVTAVLDDLTLEVLYSYPFSSNDQCMSVIVKDPTAEAGLCYAFVKGSPEKIMSMSKPETVPENFEHVLRKYTM
jgi:cation-transporting ATPase 13A3/4/5